ncbi:11734_t:CDS:2, partial [Racocetra persica]
SSDEFNSQAFSKDNSEVEQKSQDLLDSYIMHKLSKTEKSKFNYLLLKMMVENSDSLALFKFISPKIILTTRKHLSRKVLNEAVTEFMSRIKETAKKDEIGVTVTMDTQDISSERSRTSDIILKVEELFNELESLKIKTIALVTDSAAVYAAAK